MARARCPTCRRTFEVPEAHRERAFCSERCRAIDLGAWLSEAYVVAEGEPEHVSSEENEA